MIGRAARWVLGAAIATAVMVVAFLAWGVRRVVPGPPPPEPPPPSLDDERDAVVAEIDTMDRDAVIAEMKKGGF